MNISYRYLPINIANAEVTNYRIDSPFDASYSISKEGYDLRPLRVSELNSDDYLRIRSKFLELLNLTEKDGFVRGKISNREFDRQVGLHIHNILEGLNPFDASRDETWSYLTIRVLPDIARLRFPDNALERYIGRPRNTFRRLWQRAEIIGPELASGLLEDEAVQIFERTEGLGSYPELASVLAQAAINLHGRVLIDSTQAANVTRIFQQTTKRVRRELAIYNIANLSRGFLTDLVERQVQQSIHQLNENYE